MNYLLKEENYEHKAGSMAKKQTNKINEKPTQNIKALTYVLAILLSPVALGIIGYFWLLVTSPQHALVKANQGIKSKNIEQFQSYTDYKKVAQSLSHALLNLDPEKLSQLMGKEKAELFLNTPVAQIEKIFVLAVDNYFKGQSLFGTSLVGEVLTNMSFSDLWFAGVEMIDEESSPVKVTIRFSVFGGSGTVKPTLTLRENEKNWYIADIANSEQFLGSLMQIALQPKKTEADLKALSNY
ncbi:MAG: hypothetical protein QNL04_14660 [SAR324 cluster bacterium]|nr:hypothetical protein [SAR324 cluster bacterium]